MLWAAVLLATGLVACGPSFQAIYEGNARFEHCYALEENPQAPSLPTDEALMMAAPGEAPRLSSITAPAPTNAFAPPPKVLEAAAVEGPAAPDPSDVASIPVLGVDAGTPSDAARAPTLPAASCMARCANGFQECSAKGECSGIDANAQRTKSCEACPRTYRLCMRNCFK